MIKPEIDFIIELVRFKTGYFIDRYGVKPKYIKVPIGFQNMFDLPIEMKTDKATHFLGMQMCESPTIERIIDIEVF